MESDPYNYAHTAADSPTHVHSGNQTTHIILFTLGVRSLYVDAENDLVLVETNLPAAHVQDLLEATGKLVLFRGFGSSSGGVNTLAAVAIFRENKVKGLARFLQVDERNFVVDGIIDGLQPGQHNIRVRQFGDLSQGCFR